MKISQVDCHILEKTLMQEILCKLVPHEEKDSEFLVSNGINIALMGTYVAN